MRSLFQLLLLCLLAISVAPQHIQDPEEVDVESPEYCFTNEDGFGGRPISDESFSESTYFYELKMSGTDLSASVIDDIIFECELRIANYLLTETSYFTVCQNRRRVQVRKRQNVRRLQDADAVAITINPRDEPLDGYECTETEVSDGETCIVLEGAYRVYFEDGAVGTSDTMANMDSQVENGMDNDSFIGGDILKVTWLDSLEDPAPDQPSGADSVPVEPLDDEVRSASTPAIVGASVGGIMGLGLLAFYRRRTLKTSDDDTFTTPAGNNSM